MEKKKYCTYCGAENRADDLLCHRCQNNLNAEDQLLKEFLVERTKDQLKGNLDDSLRELIMNYLKSHLYGIVFTISLVSVLTVNAFSSSAAIPQVTQRPDLSDTPVVNDQNIQTKSILMSNEQLEVKEVVDTYFHAVRGLSYAGSVEETVNSLIHVEEFYVEEFSDTIVPSFEIENIDDVKTISLDYQLLRMDPDYFLYYLTGLYMDKGYQVADVTVVESLTSSENITTQTQYDITLAKIDGQWKICQVCNGSLDMKSMYFYSELLWEQAYETLQGSKAYYLPDDCGYSSFEDVKDSVELSTEFEMQWQGELGQNYRTEISDQLIEDGYRIAQITLQDGSNSKNYVMTCVNAAGDWYIAEIVEMAGE